MPPSKEMYSVGKNLISNKELVLLNAVHMQVMCVLFSDMIVIQATNLVSKIVRKVHTFEFNDMTELVFSGGDSETGSDGGFEGAASSDTTSITDHSTGETEFQIILRDKNKVLVFNAESKEEKMEWCSDIQKLLSAMKEKPLDHAKHLKF
jgi:hypothetical protein